MKFLAVSILFRRLLLISSLLVTLCSCTIQMEIRQPHSVPTAAWPTSIPEEQGIDSGLLVSMLERIIVDGVDIDSIAIIRNGYLVADIYMYPSTPDKKHALYSTTKSITSTLIGIAIDKGYIKGIEQQLIEFFPGKAIKKLDEEKRKITLANLLTMSSGLENKDNPEIHSWLGLEEMQATADWTQYALDRPMTAEPGTKFEYNNADSFLLTAILQKQTGVDALSFANDHLFEPMGIKDVLWRSSPKGISIGYGEIWLTPHDMAKLGYLYLNKGKWGSKRILSQSWIETATSAHIRVSPKLQYGYQWWVTKDFYFALGYEGQFIFIVPQRKMVVVFTSSLGGHPLFRHMLICRIISCQLVLQKALFQSILNRPRDWNIWEENCRRSTITKYRFLIERMYHSSAG